MHARSAYTGARRCSSARYLCARRCQRASIASSAATSTVSRSRLCGVRMMPSFHARLTARSRRRRISWRSLWTSLGWGACHHGMNPGGEASALGAVIVVAASTVAAASLIFRASLLTRQQEHCRLDALLDQPRRRTPPGGDSAVLLPVAVPARLVPPAIGPMCSGLPAHTPSRPERRRESRYPPRHTRSHRDSCCALFAPITSVDMASLSRQQAISMLFSGLAADLESDEGAIITVQPSGMAGDTVWVTAPRLAVAGGMRLRGRLLDGAGEPWIVTLVVAEADFHNHDLARVRLRADEVTADASRRRNPRVPAGGIAWLSAVNCQHVVDGDRVDGTMVDLSRDGVAFATNRVLRVGDRLTFHGR